MGRRIPALSLSLAFAALLGADAVSADSREVVAYSVALAGGRTSITIGETVGLSVIGTHRDGTSAPLDQMNWTWHQTGSGLVQLVVNGKQTSAIGVGNGSVTLT